MSQPPRRLSATAGCLAALAAGTVLIAPTGALGAAAKPKASVNLLDATFSPKSVTIKRNGTVSFHWKRSAHNLLFAKTSGAGSITKVQSKGTVIRTFRKKGTFQFVCTVHGGKLGKKSGMTGTVTVR